MSDLEVKLLILVEFRARIRYERLLTANGELLVLKFLTRQSVSKRQETRFWQTV